MNTGVKAVFLDLGDVIMKEETEVKNENGVTLKADLVSGAKKTLKKMKDKGYTLALVADTHIGTYKNVLSQHGIYDMFDSFAISDEVGCSKPDSRMFKKALDDLDIVEDDYKKVIMVGNNLERDILGANRLGLITVWSNWNDNDNYKSEPDIEDEEPDYTIGTLPDLISVLEKIENDLKNK